MDWVPVCAGATHQDCQTPAPARLPGQNSPKRLANAGFSLLEVLVAFTVFSLVTATVMQIFSSGVNGATVAQKYAKAAQYAESKLATAGVEEALKEGVKDGKFDDDFRWRIEVKRFDDPTPREQQSIDFEKNHFVQLFEVVATVSFTTDDSQERSVVLSTLQLATRTTL
ncbi:MAG: prepilin-type N-terminal cleavage/methylation domain-containing protein [Betaproteobacteria bacterium]|nr:prepilin-type N-terminal cleavage/methylation domain-containing protein [Betaproteobacteria bacterium]